MSVHVCVCVCVCVYVVVCVYAVSWRPPWLTCLRRLPGNYFVLYILLFGVAP